MIMRELQAAAVDVSALPEKPREVTDRVDVRVEIEYVGAGHFRWKALDPLPHGSSDAVAFFDPPYEGEPGRMLIWIRRDLISDEDGAVVWELTG